MQQFQEDSVKASAGNSRFYAARWLWNEDSECLRGLRNKAPAKLAQTSSQKFYLLMVSREGFEPSTT